MRDNFRRYLIKHFSKYGYTLTIRQFAKGCVATEHVLRDILKSKICEKQYNPVFIFSKNRSPVLKNEDTYKYINKHTPTARVTEHSHITMKRYCGYTIFYIHNDTAISIFYNKTGSGYPTCCLTLVNPRMANIYFKSALNIRAESIEDNYYGCENKKNND